MDHGDGELCPAETKESIAISGQLLLKSRTLARDRSCCEINFERGWVTVKQIVGTE